MPRRDEASSGAAGRDAVAIHRDVDFADFAAVVRQLPKLAVERGHDYAIQFGKTQLRSMLALLGLSRPRTVEEARSRAAIAAFFDEGPMRLLCDPDRAGYRFGTAFIEVVEHELFESSVRAVFERSQAEQGGRYEPHLPRRAEE